MLRLNDCALRVLTTFTTSQLCSVAHTPLVPYVAPATVLVISYACACGTLQQYATAYKEYRVSQIKILLIYKDILWLLKP